MSSKASVTKQVAFIAVMSALANVLGYFSIPAGTTKIHFMQLPIIFSGLALGSLAGGIVGFTGSAVMAFALQTPNPFILLGNAILGFFTGLFYSWLRNKKPPVIPQLLSVIGAIVIQFPYTYVSDVYWMSMPVPLVLYTILPKLFLEDMISLSIAHVILFRVDIMSMLGKQGETTGIDRGDH
ncbi:MAG: ECF transporter S component [Candidatus Bathyarchaeia archaeon]